MYWYQKYGEEHPAEGMSWAAAEDISDRIKRYNLSDAYHPANMQLKKSEDGRIRQNWPEGNDYYKSSEKVQFSSVCDSVGKIIKIGDENIGSPVLFIGNSFTAMPDVLKGASIPHYFMYLHGIQPDLLFRSGAFGLGRILYKEGLNYLQGRKVIIYCPTPNSFQGIEPLIPPIAKFSDQNLTRENLKTYNSTNWEKIQFVPPLNDTIFSIDNNGDLLSAKNTKKGQLFLQFGNITQLNKDCEHYLEIKISFSSGSYGSINVSFDNETLSIKRNLDPKDNYDVVYFKLDNNRNYENKTLKIEFFNEPKRDQIIKSIEINVLKNK